MERMRHRRRGIAAVEQLSVMVLVAVAGLGGLAAFGRGAAHSISGHGGQGGAMALASQAALVDDAAEVARGLARVAEEGGEGTQRVHVFVSNDWDVPEHTAHSFELQEELHAKHPQLKVTHFVGPYTFTDPAVSRATAEANVEWLRTMRRAHGDEIGLHIHPYSHFVEAAGLPARQGPNYANGFPGRDYGYTVNLGEAFNEWETGQLLTAAKRIFLEAHLPEPRAFRAGGWTTSTHTMRALANAGFRVEASAVPGKLLESWHAQQDSQPLYPWIMEHWHGMTEVSQPYFPSAHDAAVPGDLPILEVPDNSALADYAPADTMIQNLHRIAAAPNTGKPKVLSVGYHGVSLDRFVNRIDAALTYFDQYTQPGGPLEVVYVTAQDIADMFGVRK